VHCEIEGNDILSLDCCLEYPDIIRDDSEVVGELVAKLPLIDVVRGSQEALHEPREIPKRNPY
jgi:hypothetical protein